MDSKIICWHSRILKKICKLWLGARPMDWTHLEGLSKSLSYFHFRSSGENAKQRPSPCRFHQSSSLPRLSISGRLSKPIRLWSLSKKFLPSKPEKSWVPSLLTSVLAACLISVPGWSFEASSFDLVRPVLDAWFNTKLCETGLLLPAWEVDWSLLWPATWLLLPFLCRWRAPFSEPESVDWLISGSSSFLVCTEGELARIWCFKSNADVIVAQEEIYKAWHVLTHDSKNCTSFAE